MVGFKSFLYSGLFEEKGRRRLRNWLLFTLGMVTGLAFPKFYNCGQISGSEINTEISRSVELDEASYTYTVSSIDYLAEKGKSHPYPFYENLEAYLENQDLAFNRISADLLGPHSYVDRSQRILDFVHTFLYDQTQSGYTKRPLETLVEGAGNCEDLVTLAIKLYQVNGFETVVIKVPPAPEFLEMPHTMVGVLGKSFPGLKKSCYVTKKGEKFYLAEVTGTDNVEKPSNWKIGELPRKDFQYSLVEVYDKTGKRSFSAINCYFKDQ